MKTSAGILILFVGLFVFVSSVMGLFGISYLNEISPAILWLAGIVSFFAAPYGLAILYEDTFSVDFLDYITYLGCLCIAVLILLAVMLLAFGAASILFK